MKKGFTLIELLIVIGILAILAVAVVLVLNPAQMLAQARDSQRLSDLGNLKSAIGMYLATASASVIGDTKRAMATSTCGFSSACTIVSSTAVTGTGWVNVDLTGTSGGSPISALPVDPTNNFTYQYAYAGNSSNMTFEFHCRLESEKYRDLMRTDGGTQNSCTTTYQEVGCWYEVGTKLDF